MIRGATSGEAPPVHDDRILPVTRWVARLIVPVLAAAFLVLYGAPGRTTEFFAWTIRPDMTPLVMGAGYGTGVYYFYRVATAEEWHRVAPVSASRRSPGSWRSPPSSTGGTSTTTTACSTSGCSSTRSPRC